ncbi:MAG: glycosyltransferase family 2 protein, partial [Methylococcales bacterium]
MKLSIVVPCYNEAKNIPLILKRFDEVIDRDDISVILVDNGSTDNSDIVLNELLPDYSFARKVTVKENIGYGFGILSGLNSCDSEYLGWTHADMQTDPMDVIKALDIIESSG